MVAGAGVLVQLVKSLSRKQDLCPSPEPTGEKHLYSETSLVGTLEDAWCPQAGVCVSEPQAKMLSQKNKLK